MSPGPATYRAKIGFDNFFWSPTDVKSPQYIKRSKLSVPRFNLRMSASDVDNYSNIVESSNGLMSMGKNRTPVSCRVVDDASPIDKEKILISKQDAIMSELHSRMIQITRAEAKELRKDNKEKEGFLKDRDKFYNEQLRMCSPDRGASGNSINDCILNGEVIVKVLRVSAGRNLGPGVYPAASQTNTKKPVSHNIKGDKQFQDLSSVSKKILSPIQKKESATKRLVESFYESQKCSFIQLFQDDSGKPPSFPTSRRHSSFKATIQSKTARGSCVQSPNETINTSNESKELRMKSFSTKNTERMRKMIKDSESSTKVKPCPLTHAPQTPTREIETLSPGVMTPNERVYRPLGMANSEGTAKM